MSEQHHGLGITRMQGGRGGALPVSTLEVLPGVLPVMAVRLGPHFHGGLPHTRAHTHDFLVLCYFERGGGSLSVGGRAWQVEAGDAYVIAPGDVVAATDDPSGLVEAEGWGVFFPPEVLGPQAPGPFLSWRAHPLLFPFARRSSGNAQRLQVPPADRPDWSQRFAALDREVRQRRDGYREAVLAHLTLILVDVARLAVDVAGELRLSDEPVLAAVFGFIEERYRDRISLSDVASAVGLSPGHLTTVVRRKTGRPVQEWIIERRMAAARRLLVETDLSVEAVARTVGYQDPSYFARHYKRTHGTTPLGWRRAGRP
jgi:AraC family transcriptional activator of pobA